MPSNNVDKSTTDLDRGVKELNIGIIAMIPIIITSLALVLAMSWPFIGPRVTSVLEKIICK